MHAILLGSGLTSFVDHFTVMDSKPYTSVVDFKISDLQGHERNLYLAKHGGIETLVLSGKLHWYEGYNFDQIVALLKYVLENYTIDSFTITSASGGLSNDLTIGKWEEVKGIICFPQIKGLRKDLKNHGVLNTSNLGKTYAFHQGPSLGTIAEYKMLATLGADLVGMSMLPEVAYLVKNDVKLQLLSLPVCNYFPFDNIEEPSHDEVIKMADAATISLKDIYYKTLKQS